MSYGDFLIGYRNGRLAYSVSALLALRLLFTGRIREKQVVRSVVGWSVGLLLLVSLSVIGFLYLSTLWALLGTGILLATFGFAFAQGIAGLIVSGALADQDFYRLMLAEQVLWVSSDSENNLPKMQQVIPLQDNRRAHR
ncbi:MAG TPA: hypothetical protein VHS80_16990 [Chthoniobacterales bacterium]|nr:hypothetical protein [Chthoniobacterales bacterium]